ncbi:arginase [Roseomonas sp. 18066]|uniref:arginase n=1 Tax=Roseomonas sp. 18066 TaxID=2681412 RepID=UPI00135C40F6|nr:arginase [Roseomonas sp. 18066]
MTYGATMDLGASRRGAAGGPLALRGAGILGALGAGAADRGDVMPAESLAVAGADAGHAAHALPRIAGWVQAVRAQAAAILAEGGLPVLLGGDHSLPMGSVAASADHAALLGRPLFVLWMDAHGDFNTPATSGTGNVHGMSLAALCGETGLGAVWGEDAPAVVDPTRVMVLGARDLDAGEAALMAARGVQAVSVAALRRDGMAALAGFLDRLAAEDGLLHVSFDIDVVDPAHAPGTGTPVAGGLEPAEAAEALSMLGGSGRLVGLDIVEVNPALDQQHRTARLAVGLMRYLFGTSMDWLRQAA